MFRAVCLAILLAPAVAHAGFHLWDVNEIYSSPDGSVQFVELRALAGGQQFMAGQVTIRSTNSVATNTFVCSTNLPADTLNKTCIIGTAKLAAVPGGVSPNFVLPEHFILPPVAGGNAGVSFIPSFGSHSDVVYANLPLDGDSALARSGAVFLVATNSPQNFNNASNTIVPVKFLSSAFDGGSSFAMTFRTATGTNSTTGPNYAVEYNEDLTTTNWTALTNLTGDGTTQVISNATDVAQRFFRLRVP